MDLKELRRKRGNLIEECRRIVNTCSTESRDMSTEERTKYDQMFKDSQTLRDQIEREDNLREEERRLAETRDHVETEGREKGPTGEKRYEAMLPMINSWLRGMRFAPQNEEQRALQADLDVQGGYLKPPQQFVAAVIKKIDDLLFFRNLATIHSVSQSDSLGTPSLDTDPSDAAWTSELGNPAADSAMSLGRRELKPHALKKRVLVSEKLLAVVPSAATLVQERIAYKMAVPQEQAFLTGSGAAQPLGVFVASALGISTGRDIATGNTATEIASDNLIRVKGALKGQYRGKAQWIGHRDWETRVSLLKDSEGQYLWRPGLEAGRPDLLLGFPVNISEFAPSTFTGDQYVAVLGDFSHYWIAELAGFGLKRLDELYAGTSQVGFHVDAYVDGMPVLEEAFVRSKMG